MILPLQITFRNMSRSSAAEDLIREKAASIEKYCDQIVGCRVMVEQPHRHHRDGPHYHVRIDLTLRGEEIVVNREPSLHSGQQAIESEECTKCEELEVPSKHFEVAVKEAFDTARRLLQDYVRRNRGNVKVHEARLTGRVSHLDHKDGYGYIDTPEGRQVYFHRNSLINVDFERLDVGARVTFVEEQGEKGPQASTVRLGRRRRGEQGVLKPRAAHN